MQSLTHEILGLRCYDVDLVDFSISKDERYLLGLHLEFPLPEVAIDGYMSIIAAAFLCFSLLPESLYLS